MQLQLQAYIQNCIQEKYNISLQHISLETPPKSDMGDFAFGCFLLAKEMRKSPQAIAEEIKKYIEEDTMKPQEIDHIEVA